MANENLLRVAAALRKAVDSGNRPAATLKAVADGLRARIKAGEVLTERQREFIELDERGPQRHVIAGPGMAIQNHMLPPGMRGNGIALDFARELVAKDQAGEWVHPDRLAAARTLLAREVRTAQPVRECDEVMA